ncbi:MAG: phosphatidylserine decarboxylase family protein [Candidatus Neomarinimicrobiota bacterium]
MFAKEGKSILLGIGLVVIAAAIGSIFFQSFFWSFLLLPAAAALLFSLYFFRDPQRIIPAGGHLVIAPADGKIVRVLTVDDETVGRSATLITIFLSVFNVHVNRMPVSGVFRSVEYRSGKFLAAFDHKASDENERTDIVIDAANRTLRLKQVAGILARRIHCYARPGAAMQPGDRLGFIRFGSRTDLIVPNDCVVKVQVGQKVVGGETIIGEFDEN